MNLMASVIYDKLSNRTAVKKNRELLWDHSLKSLRLLGDGEPLTNFIYIATLDQLYSYPICKLYHATIVTLGIPRRDYIDSDINLLMLPDAFTLSQAANMVAEIFDLFNGWDAELTAVIEKTMDVQEMFDLLPEVYDHSVVLIDDSFAYVAWTPSRELPDGARMTLESVNALKLQPEFKNAKEKQGVFLYPSEWEHSNALCRNITRNNRYEARMVSEYYDRVPPSEADRAVFGYFALRVQELYNKFDEKSISNDSYGRLRAVIIDMLDKKVVSRRDIENALGALGWKLNNNYLAIAIKYNSAVELKLMSNYVCTMLETRWHDTCAVSTAENILWIVNVDRFGGELPDTFYQDLAVFLREGICRAGISDMFQSFDLVAQFCREATLAIELGEERDPTFWCYKFGSYKLDYMLRSMTEYFEPMQLCAEAVLRLRQFDAERDTQYLKTLAVYMRSRYNATQAAAELYIHRTTFNNRLERIAEITELNIEDWSTRLHLALSIELLGVE